MTKKFSFCYTWSDLDHGHFLKLEHEKFLELVPYLKGKLEVNDVVVVQRIHSDNGSNDTVVLHPNGMTFTIDRDKLDYFSWYY